MDNIFDVKRDEMKIFHLYSKAGVFNLFIRRTEFEIRFSIAGQNYFDRDRKVMKFILTIIFQKENSNLLLNKKFGIACLPILLSSSS